MSNLQLPLSYTPPGKMEEWKKHSTAFQQNIAEHLGDRIWERYKLPEHRQLLYDKIGFALYGAATEENNNRGYSKSQSDKIWELMDKCIKYSGGNDVCLAFIFLCAYKGPSEQVIVPLIRLKKGEGSSTTDSLFIDHCGRVYNDWQSFLDENIFDGWLICVPEHANYSEGSAQFYDQTQRGEIVTVLDKAASVANTFSTFSTVFGMALTMFPPTAPIGAAITAASASVGVPSTLYGTCRSIGKLRDRDKHHQSVSISDSEARACWLNTAGSVLSVGGLACNKFLTSSAKAGKVAGPVTRMACTAINLTNISVNGLSVLNFINDFSKKDKVTSLDVLQLTTSLFFFTHASMNFKTANQIILDAQANEIAAIKQNLTSKQQAVCNKMLKARRQMVETGKSKIMYGNAEFIKDIKSIENKQDFFRHFNFADNGSKFNINNELVIDPKALLQMNKEEINFILGETEKLKSGKIDRNEFDTVVKPIQRKYRLTFERQRNEAKSRIHQSLPAGINETRIARFIQQPHEIDRLSSILKEAGKNYNSECIEPGMKMANKMKCKNVVEFAAVMEFTNRRLDDRVSELNQGNPNPSAKPSGMKSKDYYRNIVYRDFIKNEKAQIGMIQEFLDLVAVCDKANSAGEPQFRNSYTAANHYDKHKCLPKVTGSREVNVTPDEYFKIARKVTTEPLPNGIWSQDGDTVVYTFECKEKGLFAIRFDHIFDSESIIGTLMPIDKK